jgi:hypothetical protein
VLGPGEQLRIDTQGSPSDDTRLVRHWGLSAPALADAGDRVELTTFDYVRVACTAWGTAAC